MPAGASPALPISGRRASPFPGSSPRRRAATSASARVATPGFARIDTAWWSTERVERESRVAICALRQPDGRAESAASTRACNCSARGGRIACSTATRASSGRKRRPCPSASSSPLPMHCSTASGGAASTASTSARSTARGTIARVAALDGGSRQPRYREPGHMRRRQVAEQRCRPHRGAARPDHARRPPPPGRHRVRPARPPARAGAAGWGEGRRATRRTR